MNPFVTIVRALPNGKATVETVGYEGESCRLADQWIRDAIGESLPYSPPTNEEDADVHGVPRR